MKKGQKLYYETHEREFYQVRQTPKMIFVEWVEHKNCDDEPLDQNVAYKKLRVKKDNSGKHCLTGNNEDRILIYPFRSGVPFYLEPATIKHIVYEVTDCGQWGVSAEYYENLKKLL